MSKNFVYSTLASGVDYHIYGKAAEGMPAHRERTITINGGAGIANKNLITPQGVVTEVTEEELSALENHSLFLLHKKNGHMTVQRVKADVEKVVADMNTQDPSKPMTPADYAGEGEDAVTAVTNSTRGGKGKK